MLAEKTNEEEKIDNLEVENIKLRNELLPLRQAYCSVFEIHIRQRKLTVDIMKDLLERVMRKEIR